MMCSNQIEVSKLELRNFDNSGYIDLFSDFKLYQESLENSLVKDIEYVSSIGAGFAYDTENYIQQSINLVGTIQPYNERVILSFLTKVNQRFILAVTKNDIEYIRYVKVPSIGNKYRANGSVNEVNIPLVAETPWLKVGSFHITSGSTPIGSGDYGSAVYGTNVYSSANIDESFSLKLLTLNSDFRVHWSIAGITNGSPIIMNLNGDMIHTKSTVTVPSGSLFEYTNIPFYCKLNLDGDPFIQNMDINESVFEVYFDSTEQNFFILEGLTDAVVTYYESYGVI